MNARHLALSLLPLLGSFSLSTFAADGKSVESIRTSDSQQSAASAEDLGVIRGGACG